MESKTTVISNGQESFGRLCQTIEELRTYEKKNYRINRIRMIISAACLLLLAVALVFLSFSIGKISKKVDEVSEVAVEAGKNINAVAEDLKNVDFEKLGQSIQNIADIGEDTLKQVNASAGKLDSLIDGAEIAMDHINSVNYEDLNNGIRELNDVLEPVAKFFNLFH